MIHLSPQGWHFPEPRVMEEDKLSVGHEAVVGLVGQAGLVVFWADENFRDIQDTLHPGIVGAQHVHNL